MHWIVTVADCPPHRIQERIKFSGTKFNNALAPKQLHNIPNTVQQSLNFVSLLSLQISLLYLQTKFILFMTIRRIAQIIQLYHIITTPPNISKKAHHHRYFLIRMGYYK